MKMQSSQKLRPQMKNLCMYVSKKAAYIFTKKKNNLQNSSSKDESMAGYQKDGTEYNLHGQILYIFSVQELSSTKEGF